MAGIWACIHLMTISGDAKAGIITETTNKKPTRKRATG